MPAVIRLGDSSTGHGCFPSTNLVATPVIKTFFNGILAGVVNSECQYATHCCLPLGVPCHSGSERSLASGASKTFIEGSPAGRVGDPHNCGDSCATGSPNSFIE